MMVVVTFDLGDADQSDYVKAYEILERIGLQPFSPKKQLDLPTTTVMGDLNVQIGADKLRDFIWEAFGKAGLQPTRLFGGVLDDWAVQAHAD